MVTALMKNGKLMMKGGKLLIIPEGKTAADCLCCGDTVLACNECDIPAGDTVCITLASDCAAIDGLTYTLTEGFSTAGVYEAVFQVGEGAYGTIRLYCLDGAWKLQFSGAFATVTADFDCTTKTGTASFTSFGFAMVCSGATLTVTFAPCP